MVGMGVDRVDMIVVVIMVRMMVIVFRAVMVVRLPVGVGMGVLRL